MLASPQQTRFDVRFRTFGFPVRVSPWFWLAAVLLAPSEAHDLGGRFGVAALLIWVGVVFVSILMHELGHALMFRQYGVFSHIVLHGFGGYASPDGQVAGHWKYIRVLLAGPAANFLIAALVWATNLQAEWAGRHEFLGLLYGYLFHANVGWGVFNLLPVWPLDGGRVCREVCYMRRVRRPEATSLKISIGVAVGLAVVGLLFLTGEGEQLIIKLMLALPSWFPSWLVLYLVPGRFGIIFMLLLAYASYEELRSLNRSSYGGYADDYGDKYPWQR